MCIPSMCVHPRCVHPRFMYILDIHALNVPALDVHALDVHALDFAWGQLAARITLQSTDPIAGPAGAQGGGRGGGRGLPRGTGAGGAAPVAPGGNYREGASTVLVPPRSPLVPWGPSGALSLGEVRSQLSRFLPRLLVLCLGTEGAEESPSPLLRPLKLFTPLKAIISPRILRHTCQCPGFIPETP